MILSLGLSSLWPPSLIQAPSQCRAQSQRHGFSVGTAAVGRWPQITARAAGVLLAGTEPPVPPPRIGTPATPSLTVSSLEWPGPPLLSSCGTGLSLQELLPRSVPAVSPLCWGAWCPHRHLTALNLVAPVSFSFRCCLLEMPLVPVSPVSACSPSDGPKACKPLNSVHLFDGFYLSRLLYTGSLSCAPTAPPFLVAFCHGCWWWRGLQNAAQWSAAQSHCHWIPSTPGPTPCCQHGGQGRCLHVTPCPRRRYL